jgi:putative transposase
MEKYGGLEINEAKRLRELKQENSKLKRMVANLMLEKEVIEEALSALIGLYPIYSPTQK